MELSINDTARFQVASQPHTVLWVLPLCYKHVCILQQAYLTYHHSGLQRLEFVEKIPLQVVSPAGTASRYNYVTEIVLYIRIRWRCAPLRSRMMNSTTSRITGVHRLVSRTFTKCLAKLQLS